MSSLAVFSLRNRALIALVTVSVAIFGFISLSGLRQELAPSIQFPQLAVLTTYQGASPEVVDQDVSGVIEDAVQGVPDLDSTSATSTTGLSLVSISFDFGVDLDTAEQKVTTAINRISSQLPDGSEPQVIRASLDDFPVLQLSVTAGENQNALADDLERIAVPEIEDLDGVREASIVGAVGQRVTIVPNADKLQRFGLGTDAIQQSLSSAGVLIPAGEITEEGETLAVQTGERLDTVADIRSLPLVGATNALGAPVELQVDDVASVRLTDDPRESISRVNGEPALTLAVTKIPDANTVEVSTEVKALAAELEQSIDGAQFEVVFDQAPFIQQSISSLATEGLLGLAFAVLVILVFLFSIRSTLVTAISIPTSVLITFIGLQAAGYTLNILTLGALTIAIGRVVDDSIVVIENIKRHLELGEEKLDAIRTAVKEVAGAITASTVTTVAVFLPISFIEGPTGELFRPFALTVTIALAASLLVALTIVPVLAYWLLGRSKRSVAAAADAESRKGKNATAAPAEADEHSRLTRGYLPVIRWTLGHRAITLVLSLAVLAGTIALAPLMQTNFLGSTGQNSLTVTQAVDPTLSLKQQSERAAEVEDVLGDIDGIEIVQSSIGSSGSSLQDAFAGGGGGSITYAITTDADADQDALADQVRTDLEEVVNPKNLTVSSTGGFGISNDIEVDVAAASSGDLRESVDLIAASLRDVDSIQQVSDNLTSSRPYIQVRVNRRDAAEFGLTEAQIGGLVSSAMQPQSIGSIELKGDTLTIYTESENPPVTVRELRRAELVQTPVGTVRLDDVATVQRADGPESITTQRGQRTATVTATPDADDIGTASAQVSQALAELDLPPGVTASIGGVAGDQADAFSQLGLALLIAILIVYIVMVATFRSLLQPLLLLISIPFAATGAIVLQLITGVPLGVASLIGVLMLVGIVVTNAIVLVDLVNQYRQRGHDVDESLIEGSARRLRPILMTALATIFALTPMALGITGHGGFISQPLAIVVIGGLISSTLLTLIVLPALYSAVEGPRDRRRRRIDAEREAEQAAARPAGFRARLRARRAVDN